MDYNEILKEAAGLMGPYCKACPVCNGRACGNCVPGPGSKLPGNTAARNYDKWQEIFVNMDTLNPNANVDTSFELFQHLRFARPGKFRYIPDIHRSARRSAPALRR